MKLVTTLLGVLLLAACAQQLPELSSITLNSSIPMPALAGSANAPAVTDERTVTKEKILVVLATALGDITVEVFDKRAPVSAASFLKYVDEGLYKGAAFYRVVSPENDKGEPVISVIQGGIVDADEGYSPVDHETTDETGILHEDGVISLARGAPGTGSGAAFFICIGAQPGLDSGGMRNPDGLGFAAFGRVVSGMDTVHAIHAQSANGPSDSPYTEGQMLDMPVAIVKAYRAGK